jgi:hypothetical protein
MMNRSEADDAIERELSKMVNARNLANPDILRATLSQIELVIVPRKPTNEMRKFAREECASTDLASDEDFEEHFGDVFESMIDAALK